MKVYTFLTDGFETVEALAVIDILLKWKRYPLPGMNKYVRLRILQ